MSANTDIVSAEIFWLRHKPSVVLDDFQGHLSPDETIELAGFRHVARQRSFILSRCLLRHVLAEKLAITKSSINFTRAESGRLILGNASPWQFSLSHAARHIAVVLAPANCGVDIEVPRRIAFERIAQRYFSGTENDWLQHTNATARAQEFFKLWTLKEAAAKALHQGLANNLSHLAFDLSGAEPRLIDAAPGLQVFQSTANDIFISAAIKTTAAVSWHIQEVQLTNL